jgi:hypothetical protein
MIGVRSFDNYVIVLPGGREKRETGFFAAIVDVIVVSAHTRQCRRKHLYDAVEVRIMVRVRACRDFDRLTCAPVLVPDGRTVHWKAATVEDVARSADSRAMIHEAYFENLGRIL